MNYADHKFLSLIYAVEELALNCQACNGYGVVWNPDARTCEKCKPICEILRAHRPDRFSTMSLSTPMGAKVVFHYPRSGQSGDVARGKKHLKIGREYTVSCLKVYESSSSVYLTEVPDIPFNSVQFANTPL